MGPLEFLVLSLPGAAPTAAAVTALGRLRASGDVRVIDTLVVSRGRDGTVGTAELADIDALRHVVS